MIIKPLDTERSPNAIEITTSKLVRLVNKHATDSSLIAIANATAAEFTLLPLSSEIVEKEIGAVSTASGGTVLATPVAFTN